MVGKEIPEIPPGDVFAGNSRHVLRLTRWGMVWEHGARAFWPLATLLALIIAAFALGVVASVPPVVLPWLAGFVLIAVVVAAAWGGLRWRRVREVEVIHRVDLTLPGRPLSALLDKAAIGGDGPLWQAHLAQMRERAAAARAVPPDAELTRRDPYALRLVGLAALVMALIFGGPAQVTQGVAALAASVNPRDTDSATIPTGPVWEGWAEPPAYTRRPGIYLNALPVGQVLELPKGTTLTFRLYSQDAQLSQTIGAVQGDDPQVLKFSADQSGEITLPDRRFDVSVLADLPPEIRAGTAPERRADGRMIQPFEAEDDHGLTLVQAQIDLDIAKIPREYGLATEPEPRDPLVLDLPIRASSKEIEGQLAEDLSRHPWANMPVTLTFKATDGIEQTGEAEPLTTTLRGRRFFDPLASALIELRRDLLWSKENSGRSAEILRAITWQPQGFVEQPLYQQLRIAVGALESGPLNDEARDKLAEALWNAAIQLEDGGLADALERMKQAQERLSEAMRNGASPDEISKLMKELQEATDEYIDMLAEQGKKDPAERFTRDQQGQSVSGDQIQQMMDEIQRLMKEGRMAEAQQLLEQFNRMMENLQVTQGQGGGQSGRPGQQSMNQLADTLREQQKLSDDAFSDMQERFGRGEFGQNPGTSDELAQRQSELREELRQQRGSLPRQGTEQGDQAGRQLEDAGRAMEEAEDALRNGDLSGALQRQADAIQSMREGMRALGDALGQQRRADGAEGEPQDQPGQEPGDEGHPGWQRGLGGEGDRRPVLDPLGRHQSGNGNIITSGDPLLEGVNPTDRARDLLDEIRRRSGEQERPQQELDYLGRLLERF